MMLWPNRVIARLKRMGFWRVMALLIALMLLWFTFLGPTDPSLTYVPRQWRW